ncbi:hypothetical protein NMY22_g14422 [Coprinellus aureogranulatus]|nr:hypothetical protein NMY22_g14422 [Coprinellus aureogranulatus]
MPIIYIEIGSNFDPGQVPVPQLSIEHNGVAGYAVQTALRALLVRGTDTNQAQPQVEIIATPADRLPKSGIPDMTYDPLEPQPRPSFCQPSVYTTLTDIERDYVTARQSL